MRGRAYFGWGIREGGTWGMQSIRWPWKVGKQRSRGNNTCRDVCGQEFGIFKELSKGKHSRNKVRKRQHGWDKTWDGASSQTAWWISFEGNHWGVLKTGQDLCWRQRRLCRGTAFIWEIFLSPLWLKQYFVCFWLGSSWTNSWMAARCSGLTR